MKYLGFWLWKQEMDRLNAWPEMSQVFWDRPLEGKAKQTAKDELDELYNSAVTVRDTKAR